MKSGSRARLASVSVDLDEIPNYFAIHGLPLPSGAAARAVYELAVPRLLSLAQALAVPMTFFVVGDDLDDPSSARRLREASHAGVEIGNHTLSHRYDLVRLGRAEIIRQVDGGAEAIRRVVGARPRGFRAPGYTITDEVFSVLQELGVAYDSSVFPCPAYYAAKTAMIGLIRARGRASRSIVDDPRVLVAPTRPYRVGTPYWSRGTGLVEIPVQVTRGPRLPFIGTSVTLGGPTRARWLARACVGEPLVNLELHGIDVLDADDGLDALRAVQVDVRVSVMRKLASIEAAVLELKSAGYTFVTMEEAAANFA